MIEFVDRKFVNGALLRQFIGQHVSIFLNIEPRAERSTTLVTGKSTDDVTVKVHLNEPLNVPLHGWVEVIGVPKSNDSIENKEVSDSNIMFSRQSLT